MSSEKLCRALVGFGLMVVLGCSSSKQVREDGPPPHPCETAECSFGGLVIDVDGEPLPGATVEFNGQTLVTDESGQYVFTLADYAGGPAGEVTATAPDGRRAKAPVENQYGGQAAIDIRFTRWAGSGDDNDLASQ